MGKALPKLAAVSLCLLSLTGCVSRDKAGPAFPESYSPNPGGTESANPSGTPGAAGFPAAKEGGVWNGFVSAVTDNPVTRTFNSGGDKAGNTNTPKAAPESKYDEVSLNTPAPKVDAAMHVSMAHVHESSNNLDAAAQAYDKALKLDAKHVPAIVGLAEIRFRQQKHDDAYQLFSQARKLDPHNLQAMLGQAHYHDTKENMPEATRLYTEATQRHPDSSAAWNDLGLCLARQGRLPESQQTLQRAVQLEPANVLYRNNVATVLVELKRNQEALVHLQHAHGQVVGHYNLGFLLHRRGDDQAAAEQFNMALRVDPSFAPAKQWLDKLNSEQGNPQRAARPPMGRSASLMPGPDGRNIPLLAKSFERGKSFKGLMAPPEIEHLATNKSTSSGKVAKAKLAAIEEDQTLEVDAEKMELAVSIAEDNEAEESVVPAAAIEISDEPAAEIEQPADNESTLEPIRRAPVSRAHRAESDQQSGASAETPSEATSKNEESPHPLVTRLLQPGIITGNSQTKTSEAIPASDLPAEISELQIADEEALQLETPPTDKTSQTETTVPNSEAIEPYYESPTDVENTQADTKPANAFPNRVISLYDSGEPTANVPSAAKPSEPANQHGWKKVKVKW